MLLLRRSPLTVTTDGEGKYTVVDLRPGVYVVTFSLQGFATVKREGLELPSNFDVNARLPHGIRMFGGTSTEKTVSNSCSAASTDPNLLLYCDGSKNGIPWITAGKIAGTVPLPWYGITFSGSLQALAGIPIGTAPVQYSVVTAGSGFNQPNGLGSNLLISRTTRYPANCAAPCTPNGLMIPGLTWRRSTSGWSRRARSSRRASTRSTSG